MYIPDYPQYYISSTVLGNEESIEIVFNQSLLKTLLIGPQAESPGPHTQARARERIPPTGGGSRGRAFHRARRPLQRSSCISKSSEFQSCIGKSISEAQGAHLSGGANPMSPARLPVTIKPGMLETGISPLPGDLCASAPLWFGQLSPGITIRSY